MIKLQESYCLGRKFCIIAHSMGGLVARHYIDRHPGRVVGLVTLATPHHGSPLADSFVWVGFFIGAGDAVDNLDPDYLSKFNRQFPVPDATKPDNCKIYTISGDSDGYDSFGWGVSFFSDARSRAYFIGRKMTGSFRSSRRCSMVLLT
ncbi:MAG: alpha/beta fold hydrolase [Dissulfuribacterales bacterium]